MQEKSNDRPVEPADTLGVPNVERPIWRRIPKGWIILTLLVVSWLAAFLVWNGILFVGR